MSGRRSRNRRRIQDREPAIVGRGGSGGGAARKRPRRAMGARETNHFAPRRLQGGRSARRVSGGRRDLIGEIARADFSPSQAARDSMQRRGRSASLRFLLSCGGAPRRVSDRHLHRRTESGPGAAIAQAAGAGVRSGVRCVGEKVGECARPNSRENFRPGIPAQTLAPHGGGGCGGAGAPARRRAEKARIVPEGHHDGYGL